MDDLSGTNLGPYKLLRRIGSGGVADVYEAVQPLGEVERRIALKVLRPEVARDPEFVRTFQTELMAAAMTGKCKHILKIFMFSEEYDFRGRGPYQCIAMQLADDTLVNRAKRHALEIREVLRVANQIGSALEYAHALNIDHLDVKPHNILIMAGEYVLTDFGIARLRFASRSNSGEHVIFGTRGYVAPEQKAGRPSHRRSDIYSFAVTIDELLQGNLSGQASSGSANRERGDRLARRLSGRWRAYDLVYRRATAEDPEQRYASVNEYLAALHRALAGRDEPPIPRLLLMVAGVLVALGGAILIPQGLPVWLTRHSPRDGAELARQIRVWNLVARLPTARRTLTIKLAEGEYFLPERLEIRCSLSITGRGPERTALVSRDSGFVLRAALSDNHVLTLQELAIEHRGPRAADVIEVRSGQVAFRRIAVRGAVGDPASREPGAGVYIRHGSGRIERSVIERNGRSGIEVACDASPSIVENVIRLNQGNGLSYFGRSSGVARGNRIEGNGLHGIAVYNAARPHLLDNAVVGSVQAGIAVFGGEGCRVDGNTLSRNGRYGLCISSRAQPALGTNVIADNAPADVELDCRTLGDSGEASDVGCD